MSNSRLTVLYDGGCPLCRREIDHYRKIAPDRAIDWVDVTRPKADLSAYGVTREQAMRRFHVIDADGQPISGARGFIALWTALPGYRWLATLVQTLHLAPLLEWFYRHFARWHFRRRCPGGSCQLPGAGEHP